MVEKFDQDFIQGMKSKLDVEVIGVAAVNTSAPELMDRAARLLTGVKSVVVLGKETYKEVLALMAPSKETGEAAPGELLGSHIDYLYGRLNRAVHELAAILKKEGYRSLPLPAASPTDQRFLTALLSYRHAAQLAGIGTIGRHSLVITPEYGPRARLACVLTEAPLEASPTRHPDYCMDCDACIRECPAGALQVPKDGEVYSINKFACRTYRHAGLTCSVCVKACDEVLG